MINDPRHRTTITKLRTHSHCLQTETGNYTKGERDYKCPNCDSGAIETVTHFLWECPCSKFKGIRSLILQILPTKTRDHSKLTKIILNLDFQSDDRAIQKVYSLVHKMYKIREKAFKNQFHKISLLFLHFLLQPFFLLFSKFLFIYRMNSFKGFAYFLIPNQTKTCILCKPYYYCIVIIFYYKPPCTMIQVSFS